MNFQRFLRSSALLGVLGSVFLNTSSYGMEDPTDPEGGAHGLVSRTAALSVSASEELASDVSAAFLQKIMGLPKIYGTKPTQFPINLKIKFVPILGKEEDKLGLQALFGDTDEGSTKVSEVLAEQIAAVKECISTRTLGNLKWLYFVSYLDDSFEPVGYFETQGHKDYKLTEGSVPSYKRSLFEDLGQSINTFCFEAFHREIKEKFPLPSIKETPAPYMTLAEAIDDKELVNALAAHFQFNSIQDPTDTTISYQTSLLGVRGNQDSEDFISFGIRSVTQEAGEMNLISLQSNMFKVREILSNQLRVLNSFRYGRVKPMNLDGTTFLVRKSTDSRVVGFLKLEKDSLVLQMMDRLCPKERLAQIFTSFVDDGFVGTQFGQRRLLGTKQCLEKQAGSFTWQIIE